MRAKKIKEKKQRLINGKTVYFLGRDRKNRFIDQKLKL